MPLSGNCLLINVSIFKYYFFLFVLGFLLFKDYCMNEIDEAVPQLKFYEEVRNLLSSVGAVFQMLNCYCPGPN